MFRDARVNGLEWGRIGGGEDTPPRLGAVAGSGLGAGAAPRVWGGDEGGRGCRRQRAGGDAWHVLEANSRLYSEPHADTREGRRPVPRAALSTPAHLQSRCGPAMEMAPARTNRTATSARTGRARWRRHRGHTQRQRAKGAKRKLVGTAHPRQRPNLCQERGGAARDFLAFPDPFRQTRPLQTLGDPATGGGNVERVNSRTDTTRKRKPSLCRGEGAKPSPLR